MKPPVTLLGTHRPWPHLALGLWLGMTAVYPCLAEDDLAAPLLDNTLRTLDIGFRDGNWSTPYNFEPCMRPCTKFSRPDPTLTNPNPSLSYKHDFSFSIKESGPLSFRVSGSRLKMKVEF